MLQCTLKMYPKFLHFLSDSIIDLKLVKYNYDRTVDAFYKTLYAVNEILMSWRSVSADFRNTDHSASSEDLESMSASSWC